MRLIAGRHRGRRLIAPAGGATRPTADRVRQALFDMLLHAPWSPFASDPAALATTRVLDAFAGTGALGLEALSRGAAHATFLETDRLALAALRENIATCDAAARSAALAADATRPPPAATGCGLVFLDPPYGGDWVARSLPALAAAGWIAPGALVCIETERPAPPPPASYALLAERTHGAAQLGVFRA